MDQEQTVDVVRDWLDNEGWNYDYDAGNHMIRTGVSLNCKLRMANVFICILEDGSYTVNTVSPINGDPKDIGEMLKYLTMATYGITNGNFELDVRNGEIHYKTYVNCKEIESLPGQIIRDSILVGWYMMECYGNGIAALALGFSDAETEFKKAKGESEKGESE